MGNYKFEEIQKMIEEKQQPALPVNTVTVTVKLQTSDLLQEAAKVYFLEGERVLRFTSNPNMQISEDEFFKYFSTLLYLRVSRVNGNMNATTKGYQADFRSYYVPAFVHNLLCSIGKAVDYDYGFEFVPELKQDLESLLSPEEMRDISRRLSYMAREGLVCVDTGVSLQPTGELAFMATLSVNDQILSYRKDHPIYGFYAAFFKHEIISGVLDPKMLRIKYGAVNDYNILVQQIV